MITGELNTLLIDSSITEIVINGHNHIYYEKEGCWHKWDKAFENAVELSKFIHQVLMLMDKTADQRYPMVGGVIKNWRIHVALPPVTKHPHVTIRKHQQSHMILKDLVNLKFMTDEQRALLVSWMVQKKNILICGPTGCGKTTLARALLLTILETERLLVLEDTDEIGTIHSNTVHLLTRESVEGLVPDIDLNILLRHSLRMRPDRIIVGETRGTEALTLLDALATGHQGSLTTLHAHTPAQALRRLETLVSRAAPQWSATLIRQLICDAINVIVCLKKEGPLRQIDCMSEISGFESFGFLLNEKCRTF